MSWRSTARVCRSEDSTRIIVLEQGTADVLEAWRERQLFERLEWGEAWQDSGQVVSAVVGHSTSAFTMDVYAVVADELAEAAAVAMAAFVPRKPRTEAAQ